MGSIHWLQHGNDVVQAKRLCDVFLGVEVHPTALEHLVEGRDAVSLAFPRLESHGTYLFGTLFVPSNVDNPSADFDSIVFVATHDDVVASIGPHHTSDRDWTTDMAVLGDIDTTDSTPDGGQFILNTLRLVIREHEADASTILRFLREESARVQGGIDLTKNLDDIVSAKSLTRRERRDALQQITELLPTVSGIAAELPTMRRIASETALILESIVNDDSSRELRTDRFGVDREMFSRFLEIFLVDCLLDARRLLAMLDEVEGLTEAILERSRQLSEEENVAAGRFTGAIASIMLLPTFIVGLYGQNFAEMPETDWQYGYLFSWGSIVLLTVFQVLFFRRRRWI